MTFIAWSDPEGLFGLLLEYLADERADHEGDHERWRFLSDLMARLEDLEERLPDTSLADLIQGLQQIHESVESDSPEDPVMTHLRDCIAELERVQRELG